MYPTRLVLLFALANILAAPAHARAAGGGRAAWPSHRYAIESARADTLFLRSRTAGYAYLDSLLAVARALGDRGLEGVVQVERATQKLVLERRLVEARSLADPWTAEFQTLRDTVSWCRALRVVAAVDLFSERYHQADDEYRQVLRLTAAARLPELEAYPLIGRGYVAITDGRYADAERDYRRALRRTARFPDDRAARTARAGLANSLNHLGRVDEARREYERVRDESRTAGDARNLADALNDLGNLEYLYGDPGRAAELYREASGFYRVTGVSAAAIVCRTNEGRCLMNLDRVDEAAALFDSLAVATRPLGASDARAIVLIALARARVLQQRPAEAEASLRAVIAQADSISFDSYLDATHALCWVMTETGRPDSAARIAGDALDRLDPKLADPARARLLYSLGNAELLAGRPGEALEPLCRASLLQGRGAGLSQISRMRSEEALARGFDALGQRDSALFHFRAATRAWERSRAAPNDPAWREAFAGAAATLFCEYAARLLDPAAGGTPAARAARAFTALQDFRSRALEEQLLGAEARAQVARVRLNELQRALADHEVLLDIYPSRDTTVVLAVTRDRILAATTAGAIRLSPRLKRLSELLQSREPGGEGDAQRGAEEALGTDLFGGVADLIRPARSALISAGGWDVHPLGELRVPGEIRELSRARELGIMPSATLLAASRRATREAGSGGFLMLARATGPSKSPLDGVKSETRALRARFPHGEFRSNAGERTLEDMIAHSEGREILHVASHTRWNSSAPWRAGFLLGRGDDEEAYLTAARICRLRGAARLCVLASCSSAGQPTVRESMPPLGAAWLAAGAQAVIATLWPVDDAATAEFVAHFYDALERGRSAGGALADAQAATRRTRGREASGYWAGYVLLGDPATHVRLRASAPASPARR